MTEPKKKTGLEGLRFDNPGRAQKLLAESQDLSGLTFDNPERVRELTAPAPKVQVLDPIAIEGDPNRPDRKIAQTLGEPVPEPPSTGESFGRGAAQAASMGVADEASGFGAWLAGLGQDAPRAAGRGIDAPLDTATSDYSVGRDAYRAEDAIAKQENPRAYLGGQVTGAVGTAAAPIGRALQGLSYAERMRRLAQTGAAIGGISAAGSTENDLVGPDADPGSFAVDTAIGTEVGAIAGPVLGTLADDVAAPAVSKLGEWAQNLRERASANRVAATGTYGAQLRNLAQNKGADGTAAREAMTTLGEDIERLGIHEGDGVIERFLPQPVSTYEQNSARVMADANARRAAAEGQIVDLNNPIVDTTGTITDLTNEASRLRTTIGHRKAGEEAGALTSQADELLSKSDPVDTGGITYGMPLDRALSNRRYIDKQIDYTRKGGGENAPMNEAIDRWVAGDLRRATKESLARAAEDPSTGVTPEMVNDWLQANRDYSVAATVHDPAMARMWQEYGNQKISLPTWIAASGANARSGPAEATLTVFLAQAVKERGASALAGTQRAGQKALQAVGGAIDSTATPLAASQTQGAVAEFANGMAMPAFAQDDGPTFDQWMAVNGARTPEQSVQFGKRTATDPEFRARLRANAQEK